MSVRQYRLASAGLWGLRERSVQVSVNNHNGFLPNANIAKTRGSERALGRGPRAPGSQYSVSIVFSAAWTFSSGPRNCIIFSILPEILTLPCMNAFCPSSSPLLTWAEVS